ncbi:IQ calmodulin-binding motif-containing protein 1 isoform X2 [Salmo salar]|uniref:IQ calmodulin-binding motif-containing protein 1 isoform X2 n=1 Tax=Salmo salar TaxID=8030 RepID=A0ABM3D5A8_SALSA|nr:IQ calmodulin-binding motif-containing protein 1 isoform X2 [Salmo salar]
MSLARKDAGLRALVASTNINPEQKVPQILSKLQDILNRISVQDDRELGAFKNSLFSHGILQYCAGDALKLNYAKVEGGYATATQLAEILSSCCVGVDLGGDTEAFHRRLLPSVTDSLLSLASRLMNRALAGNGQPEMFRFFRKVMGSVCWLLKAHGHLATQVLQSDHYERMLMSEEERVGTVCVSLWHQLLTANSELVAGLGKGPLSVILDDVVYRMAHTSNPAVGGAAIRTLLLVARQQESALQLIIHRFKGLEGMIGREWRGRGFDEEVDQLIKLLHKVPKPADHTETWPEECVRAACVIQAAWRSYQTRRRVKSLPRAVRSLQRSFRERRQRRVQQAQAECWEEELRLQLCVRRQRARREFHQKQLQLLQLLSPGTHTLPVTAETESQERVPSETTTVTTVTVPRYTHTTCYSRDRESGESSIRNNYSYYSYCPQVHTHYLLQQRQRVRREFHQKQLQLLQLLSPGTHTLPVTAETESQERVPSETTTVTTVTVPRYTHTTCYSRDRESGESSIRNNYSYYSYCPQVHTHYLLQQRQRARREFHQKQLQLLQLLSPGQVQQYLGEVERQAVIRIQRVWRGHRERRHFQQRRNTHTQHRAAVVLQRAVLRFLKRRRAEKAPPSLSPWIGPRGLTDSRRAELKREVEEHIALHPSSVVSLEGSRELHAQTQALLLQHLQGRDAELREHTHTHALLAQINTDLELLLNAPSLSVATATDCDVFRSRSAPVAARARQSHNALLQAGRLPWWKMLGDGDINCPESESAHTDSLYLGGS